MRVMMASIGYMKRARAPHREPLSPLTHTTAGPPMPLPPPTHKRHKPSLSLVELCARAIVNMCQIWWLGAHHMRAVKELSEM